MRKTFPVTVLLALLLISFCISVDALKETKSKKQVEVAQEEAGTQVPPENFQGATDQPATKEKAPKSKEAKAAKKQAEKEKAAQEASTPAKEEEIPTQTTPAAADPVKEKQQDTPAAPEVKEKKIKQKKQADEQKSKVKQPKESKETEAENVEPSKEAEPAKEVVEPQVEQQVTQEPVETTQTKEKKQKAPKPEKAPKAPKEEKLPKAPKEEKVKLPPAPRNTTQEAINKANKHQFWNNTLNAETYLSSHKTIGSKKNACLQNEQKRIQGVASAPAKNLCQLMVFNPAEENKWVEWRNNTESGKYRFSNNGTSCDQVFNWVITQTNNKTASESNEQGSFESSSSTQTGLTYKCIVNGTATSNSTRKDWQSVSSYSMSISGSKRGEEFTKNTKENENLGQNHTISRESTQQIVDTISIERTSLSVNGTTASVFTRIENKKNVNSDLISEILNTNTTLTKKNSSTSKTLSDKVEVHAEGSIFSSETSKVKEELSNKTVDGVVVIESGITDNRTRSYKTQNFGESANQIFFSDNGSDRKWKTNSLKPLKNIDTPNTWDVSGSISQLEPVQEEKPVVEEKPQKAEKKKEPKSEKKIDL